MEFLYDYSVAAKLTPETRYDQMVETLNGHDALIHEPNELHPTLERAFKTSGPTLINVLTNPSVAYPRSTNLT